MSIWRQGCRPELASRSPNTPHHIVQRGHAEGAVLHDSDRTRLPGDTGRMPQTLSTEVYAYCLMSNHVHLVVDPGDDARALSALMKRLAGRHARRLNLRNSGAAHLGEPIQVQPDRTDRYLLTCGSRPSILIPVVQLPSTSRSSTLASGIDRRIRASRCAGYDPTGQALREPIWNSDVAREPRNCAAKIYARRSVHAKRSSRAS